MLAIFKLGRKKRWKCWLDLKPSIRNPVRIPKPRKWNLKIKYSNPKNETRKKKNQWAKFDSMSWVWLGFSGFVCLFDSMSLVGQVGWFCCRLFEINWVLLSFWVSGFLSVWDFWVFFDFMILAMNLWARTRKTDGFSALVFVLFSNFIALLIWF